MYGFFDEWNLTEAERDVAIMILKGHDNGTIARVRNTATGTVRAQATSIYSKSATHGRTEFVSLFMEELMSGGLGERQNTVCTPSADPDPAARYKASRLYSEATTTRVPVCLQIASSAVGSGASVKSV